jgi:hypothetical protein
MISPYCNATKGVVRLIVAARVPVSFDHENVICAAVHNRAIMVA